MATARTRGCAAPLGPDRRAIVRRRLGGISEPGDQRLPAFLLSKTTRYLRDDGGQIAAVQTPRAFPERREIGTVERHADLCRSSRAWRYRLQPGHCPTTVAQRW